MIWKRLYNDKIKQTVTDRKFKLGAKIALMVLIAAAIALSWSSYFDTTYSDPIGAGDYLPFKLQQGMELVQSFSPQNRELSEIAISFAPPVEIVNADDVAISLAIISQPEAETVFTISLNGDNINRYTDTTIALPAGKFIVGQVYELNINVGHLADSAVLAINTIQTGEYSLTIDGSSSGLAMAMVRSYREFNTIALIFTIILYLVIGLLLFLDMGILRKIFTRPAIPLLVAPLPLLLIVELLNTLNNRIWLSLPLVVLSYLLVLLVLLFLTGISRKPRISIYIGLFIFGAFAIVNHMKQFFRGDPFVAGDMTSARMVMKGVNQLMYIIDVRFILALMLAVVFILLFVHATPKIDSRRWQISLLAGSAAGLLLLTNLVVFNDTIMSRYLDSGRYPWNPMMDYRKNGFTVPFTQSIKDLFISSPQTAERIPEDLYLSPVLQPEPDPGSPNIIAIMSESYADFRNIRPLTTTEPVMPFFDQLVASDNVVSGNLLVPVFGGGTCNTEFEYLTGSTMLFLNDASVPYLNYFKKTTHSLPDLLNQQGYRSIAIHPYLRSFWDRENVYPQMGFDEFIGLEDFPEGGLLNRFISDQRDFELIVEQLENKQDSERLFVFSVTMQNHFPYHSTEENHANLNYHIKLPELNDAEGVELYLSMLRESDDALRYLVEYLEDYPEPTLLVFFGDHLPGNNNVFNSFFEDLFGKTIAELDFAETLKLYETPYFFWANYDLPSMDVPMTSSNFLATMTLDLAGVEMSPYFEFVAQLNESIMAMNNKAVLMQNERKYDKDNLPPSIIRLLDRYWVYQYDNIVKPLEP